MGSTWVLSAPDGPHVGPMNLAIRVVNHRGPWSRTLYISKERTMYCTATNLGHAGLLLIINCITMLQYFPKILKNLPTVASQALENHMITHALVAPLRIYEYTNYMNLLGIAMTLSKQNLHILLNVLHVAMQWIQLRHNKHLKIEWGQILMSARWLVM